MKISHKIGILIIIGIVLAVLLFGLNQAFQRKMAQTYTSLLNLETANELILKAIIQEKKFLTDRNQKESQAVQDLFNQSSQTIQKITLHHADEIKTNLSLLLTDIAIYQQVFGILHKAAKGVNTFSIKASMPPWMP